MEREELTKRLAALRHDLRGSPMAKPEFSANIPDTLGQRLDRFAAAISSAKKTGSWKKTRFNLFTILGRSWIEETHSNLLAWLLDPDEAHGLDGTFLERFYFKVTKRRLPRKVVVTVVREHVSVLADHSVEDRRRGRFDIVVQVSFENGRCERLIIETKVGSAENPGQTNKYLDHCSRFGIINKDFFLVYISVKEKAENPAFFNITYSDINRLLSELPCSGDTETLLRHFREHVTLDLQL